MCPPDHGTSLPCARVDPAYIRYELVDRIPFGTGLNPNIG